MTSDTSSNKRIAKNTAYLYVRQLIVIVVTFFTFRIILDALGDVEYGVYSLVGGLAFSFGFFSSSLTNVAQRYLSYAQGENDINISKSIFNSTAYIFILIGGVTILIGCLIGPVIISHLKVPSNLMFETYFVYYCTIISLAITLIASMFDSILISRENMKVYSYISILDVAGKLIIAYIIMYSTSNKLIIYAISTMSLTIIIKSILIIICYRNYEECHIRLYWDKKKIAELSKFIGWNGVGTMAYAIFEQGVNVLLNLFFGPIVNAAKGIAYQIKGAVTNFTNNFLLAIYPQMIKSYAKKDIYRFNLLFNYSGKFGFALLWFLFLPIILRRDLILNLWLKNVPEYTSSFLLWIIIYGLVDVFTNPGWFAIQSIGKIKKYMLYYSIILLIMLPFDWISLKIGLAPEAVFIIMIFGRLVILIYGLINTAKYVDIKLKKFVRDTIIPCVIVIVISYIICQVINLLLVQSFIGLIINTIATVIINGIIMYYVLLNSNERILLRVKIADKIGIKYRF